MVARFRIRWNEPSMQQNHLPNFHTNELYDLFSAVGCHPPLLPIQASPPLSSPCLYRSPSPPLIGKGCQVYCAAQFPNGRGLSNKLNFPLRFNSVMGFDTNGAKSCKKEFFAPLLKIVNDDKNHNIYFYRSSTIYSRGGQAFLLDALPLLIFSKDPLRQCNVFRHLIYLLSRYSCYL